ncbi:MAG: hypothetical protein JO115_23875 [Pseudonocardiales bacterium]|nr:hypothetical protein [Pseudonocardiales bacterium]
MKTYRDFISDIVDDTSLYEELCQAVPFSEQAQLNDWFATRGYQLNSTDVEVLFANQEEVAGSDEQVNY